MSDITKKNLKYVESVDLGYGIVWLGTKDDATAIARHFGSIDEAIIKMAHELKDGLLISPQSFDEIMEYVKAPNQSETDYLNSTKANKERLEESIKQAERGETVETTYNSEIGEIKRNHKDGDYSYLCGREYCKCTQ